MPENFEDGDAHFLGGAGIHGWIQTTIAPFFMYLPTLSDDLTSGVKSGWWASSTGVGNGDDDEVGLADDLRVGAAGEMQWRP